MQKKRPKDPIGATAALRSLPGVARLLESRPFEPILRRYGSTLVTDLVRERLERLRKEILAGREVGEAASEASLAEAVAAAAAGLLDPRPRPVINATGIVIHTNLGRSLLSTAAARQVAAAAGGYLDLEYDRASGGRGSRLAHLEPLLGRLFPGHASAVFNNNAAAVMICLRALAHGREALISRGELVEIGGSFRIPDILEAAGAHLREVGTTNRTRLADYEAAISPRAGLILKVHTSNFRIVGFAEETDVPELAELAGRSKLPLVVDWGSGNLTDLAQLGLRDELPVARILAEGADLVTFSGDKLLGGPQAGFVVGREDLIARIKQDPLARVCRLGRLMIGAIHRTLAAHVRGTAFDEVPTLRMLALGPEQIEERAQKIRSRVLAHTSASDDQLQIVDGISRTGGGSSPTGERPTRLLAVSTRDGDAGAIEQRLRAGEPAIIGRVNEGRLLLDLRTVLPEQDAIVAKRLAEAIGK